MEVTMKTLAKLTFCSAAGLLVLTSPRAWALTETLTMDVLPETQGWELYTCFQGSSSVDNGILTLETQDCIEYVAPGSWLVTVDTEDGWDITFRMRFDEYDPSDEAIACLWIHDNTLLTTFCINENRVFINYPTIFGVPLAIGDVFHTYRVDGIGTSIKIFVDD